MEIKQGMGGFGVDSLPPTLFFLLNKKRVNLHMFTYAVELMHSSEKPYVLYFTLMSRIVVFKCDPKTQHFNCLGQVLRETLSTTFSNISEKLSQLRPGPKGQVIREHVRSTYGATLLHCMLNE